MGLKYVLKKMRKEMKKAQKEQEVDKQKLITAIWEVNDVFDLYKDEEQTIPMTLADLNEMTPEELMDYFEEILEEAESQV